MSSQFANNQPAGYENHLRDIAVVGATGQMGGHIVAELLETGKHTVTAISRIDSTSQPPDGVQLARVDYNDESTIVEALKGQDALIITMNTGAPTDISMKLVEAAAKAGVRWIVPDEWGANNEVNLEFERDVFLGPPKQAVRDLIKKLGVSSYTGISGGFWYDFSLGTMKEMFGFDFQNHEVTFFDDGKARMDTSTWKHEARAVRSLLSLKILPDDENDKSITLDRNFKNKFAFLSSFCVNQRDMFESVKPVTHTTDDDWTIKSVSSKGRYEEGVKTMNSGNMFGFVQMLYARGFYPEEPILFRKYGELSNDVLGLPKEDFDECTRRGVERGIASRQK